MKSPGFYVRDDTSLDRRIKRLRWHTLHGDYSTERLNALIQAYIRIYNYSRSKELK